MIGVAAAWILILLFGGGLALDRILTNAITANFDDGQQYVLTSMVAAAEIDDFGEVRLNRPLGDQRFLEPYSGFYWQISGKGFEPFRSRSLWDRALKVAPDAAVEAINIYDSNEFGDEPLRIAERDIVLPGSPTVWRFKVAQSRALLDEQIGTLRRTLINSFALLALGLLALAALQTLYGLWPLRSLRQSIAAMPADSRKALARENGREPKKPLCADSGEGCAARRTRWRPPSTNAALRWA